MTTSPTSTSSPATTPSIGARMSVRSRSCWLVRRIASASASSLRLMTSAASALSMVDRASATSVGVTAPRPASWASRSRSRRGLVRGRRSAWADRRLELRDPGLAPSRAGRGRRSSSSLTSRSPALTRSPSSTSTATTRPTICEAISASSTGSTSPGAVTVWTIRPARGVSSVTSSGGRLEELPVEVEPRGSRPQFAAAIPATTAAIPNRPRKTRRIGRGSRRSLRDQGRRRLEGRPGAGSPASYRLLRQLGRREVVHPGIRVSRIPAPTIRSNTIRTIDSPNQRNAQRAKAATRFVWPAPPGAGGEGGPADQGEDVELSQGDPEGGGILSHGQKQGRRGLDLRPPEGDHQAHPDGQAQHPETLRRRAAGQAGVEPDRPTGKGGQAGEEGRGEDGADAQRQRLADEIAERGQGGPEGQRVVLGLQRRADQVVGHLADAPRFDPRRPRSTATVRPYPRAPESHAAAWRSTVSTIQNVRIGPNFGTRSPAGPAAVALLDSRTSVVKRGSPEWIAPHRNGSGS